MSKIKIYWHKICIIQVIFLIIIKKYIESSFTICFNAVISFTTLFYLKLNFMTKIDPKTPYIKPGRNLSKTIGHPVTIVALLPQGIQGQRIFNL